MHLVGMEPEQQQDKAGQPSWGWHAWAELSWQTGESNGLKCGSQAVFSLPLSTERGDPMNEQPPESPVLSSRQLGTNGVKISVDQMPYLFHWVCVW